MKTIPTPVEQVALEDDEEEVRFALLRVATEDKRILRAFSKLANKHMVDLIALKEQQHAANKRLRYSPKTGWQWASVSNPKVAEKYRLLSLRFGSIPADAYLYEQWKLAHPPRPSGRPRGLLTANQMHAIANARALAGLLGLPVAAARTAPRNGAAEKPHDLSAPASY